MNALSLLAFAVLLISFFGVLAYNAVPGTEKVTYAPPYYFIKDDALSYMNAYFFVLIFSLLLFGMGAPIAMAIEGTKYAVLVSILPVYDLVFILPELCAMLAASKLGEGVMADWSGEGNIYNYWSEGIKLALIGFGLLLVLMFARPFVLTSFGFLGCSLGAAC
ncbi:MAG: hypothetical protein WCX64_01815 [Candidatus Micrarchaeia archaeon]